MNSHFLVEGMYGPEDPVHVYCFASRDTTLLDCTLHLMQYLYDPGVVTSCANQCILGKVHLRSNLSRIP